MRFFTLPFIFALLSLSACSTQQAYYGLQTGHKNQCQKYLPNDKDYQRCLEANDISFEQYQKRVKELKTTH